ncbi:sulfate transporter CysZ [Aidingimonas halophila]|uniref:Sulfate transporter CysZ n=1 Tax=Aidingimonas halophila TaxID=574349 RepID=A0A1H2XD99_9GAMM|nr:sulfate transporter CysZ [Aidingimonas halophila]GHC28550.1 sulfate transporter CysZ [Aidingimonas halophila]SDW90830.1 CysZ protein [Aidingimonas halophila]
MFSSLAAVTQGVRTVYTPGMRRYVFMPIAINLMIYAVTLHVTWTHFGGWLDAWMAMVPGWLEWLEWLIWPLFVVALIIVVFFTFTLVTHLIAAPFYGFLAAKVETRLTGRPPADDRGLIRTGVDAMGRELRKLGYILPRLAVLLVLSWIPLINLVTPVLWAVFAAWMMAITYLDYPMDNNRVSFPDMKRRLGKRWWQSLTFGAWVTLLTWVPLANVFLLPGAVAGAVQMWERHYRGLSQDLAQAS